MINDGVFCNYKISILSATHDLIRFFSFFSSPIIEELLKNTYIRSKCETVSQRVWKFERKNFVEWWYETIPGLHVVFVFNAKNFVFPQKLCKVFVGINFVFLAQ